MSDKQAPSIYHWTDKPSEILLLSQPDDVTCDVTRDYKWTGWINKSRGRAFILRWNGIPTIGTIGERGKFQTFTETRIFRHVKIHEHVRTWNRSFRGGKFPRKKGGEGRGLNDTWPTKSCGGNAARRHLAPPQSFHPSPPLEKAFFIFPSFPFFFFFNFPSLDGLFNEGSMQELEKFPSKSRCSGNI